MKATIEKLEKIKTEILELRELLRPSEHSDWDDFSPAGIIQNRMSSAAGNIQSVVDLIRFEESKNVPFPTPP